jgi:hypothetical protein
MTTTVWKVLRAFAGLETGRPCRCCKESIPARDAFGMSEGVCHPCRATAG